MSKLNTLGQHLKNGGRWIWFWLTCFVWRIALSLALFGVGFLLVAPPAFVFGFVDVVVGTAVAVLAALAGLIVWLVILGALAHVSGLGYPRLSVDIWLESPNDSEGDGDTPAQPSTTTTEAQPE